MAIEGGPGGAGAGGAGAGAPDGGAPATGAPAESTWLEGVTPDLTQWASEQGMKGVNDALAGHRGMVRLKGVPERELLRLSDKWEDNPDASAAIYNRLGRPEKLEGYEIPDVMVGDGDTNLAGDFRKWAYDAGLSARQANALATNYQGAIQAYGTQRAEALEQRDTQQEIALKSEWGGAFDENVGAGKRAWASVAKSAGLEVGDIEAMQQSIGYTKTMKLFASMGRALGEHEPVGGEPELAFGMTPAAANKKADALTAELFSMDRSSAKYEQQKEEITRLRHLATGEAIMPYMKARGG